MARPRTDPLGRPPWGGRNSTRLRALVLARDYDPALGYAPCHHCHQPADSVDHWPIPRSRGGPDHESNMVACCLPCNVARGVVLAREAGRPAVPSRHW